MFVRVRLLWWFIRETARKFVAVRGLFLASGLAFDLLLYCIPLLFLILSTLGYVLAGSDRAVAGVQEVLQRLLPVSQRAVAGHLDLIAARRSEFGAAGFVLFLIFSTATFGSVRLVLNIVFEVDRPRGFIWGKAVDLFIMLTASGLFVAAIAINSVLAFLKGLGRRLPVLGPLIDPGWAAAGHLLGFLLTVSLFYVLYRFCPAREIGRMALWSATVMAAVLFELSKWVFSWYVSVAKAYLLLYGTLSVFLFSILWIYYSSLVFIFSAVVGSALEQRSRSSKT